MKAKPAILSSLFLIISLLFITTIHASLQDSSDASLQCHQHDNILYVGGSGPNNYTSIQSAINDADNGYTIYVYHGIYQENIVIHKSISLIGISENGEKPIINTSENKSTVTIIADNCILRGFTVKSRPDFNSENPPACYMQSNNSIVDNNTFLYGEYACYMYNSSYNTVQYNEFIHGYNGGLRTYHGKYNTFAYNIAKEKQLVGLFFVGDSNSVILGNTATNNIHGMSVDDSSNCAISDNLIHDNIQYGFTASMSSNLSISNNTVYSHYYGGMMLMDCSYCTVSGNEIYDNGWGISLESNWYQYRTRNKNNLVIRNTITENGVGIALLTGSKNNSIIENNLINNSRNSWFSLYIDISEPNTPHPLYNEWDGNYWSEWESSSPRPIKGVVTVYLGRKSIFLNIPWFMFDKHPATQPCGNFTLDNTAKPDYFMEKERLSFFCPHSPIGRDIKP